MDRFQYDRHILNPMTNKGKCTTNATAILNTRSPLHEKPSNPSIMSKLLERIHFHSFRSSLYASRRTKFAALVESDAFVAFV